MSGYIILSLVTGLLPPPLFPLCFLANSVRTSLSEVLSKDPLLSRKSVRHILVVDQPFFANSVTLSLSWRAFV